MSVFEEMTLKLKSQVHLTFIKDSSSDSFFCGFAGKENMPHKNVQGYFALHLLKVNFMSFTLENESFICMD